MKIVIKISPSELLYMWEHCDWLEVGFVKIKQLTLGKERGEDRGKYKERKQDFIKNQGANTMNHSHTTLVNPPPSLHSAKSLQLPG